MTKKKMMADAVGVPIVVCMSVPPGYFLTSAASRLTSPSRTRFAQTT